MAGWQKSKHCKEGKCWVKLSVNHPPHTSPRHQSCPACSSTLPAHIGVSWFPVLIPFGSVPLTVDCQGPFEGPSRAKKLFTHLCHPHRAMSRSQDSDFPCAPELVESEFGLSMFYLRERIPFSLGDHF